MTQQDMTGSQADSFLTPRVEAQVKMTALFPLDKVDVNVNSVAAFLSPDSRTTMQSALHCGKNWTFSRITKLLHRQRLKHSVTSERFPSVLKLKPLLLM